MAKRLLTIGGDAKTIKGEPLGYRTAVMYLAPASLSGHNVCALSTSGCRLGCLNTAGRGAFTATQAARLARTLFYFQRRDAFMLQLANEVSLFVRASRRAGMTPCVRLNGTSDIRWERVPVGEAPNIFTLFADVQFYDYTKLPPLARKLPPNYHLTFSLAETARNWTYHLDALTAGLSVAVVLRGAGTSRWPLPFPEVWNGRPLINGDEHDLRFLDRPAVYVGLRAKGRAVYDTSGFVRSIEGVLSV